MALGYLIPYDPHGIKFTDVVTGKKYSTVLGTPAINPNHPERHGEMDVIDLRIFSVAPLAIAIPTQKRNTLQIPGKNGQIDLSTVLTKVPVYDNRSGSFEFVVDNNYPNESGNWADKYEAIVNALHGRRMKVQLVDDPGWYYIGNIQVGEWKATHPWASVTINYDLEPYKYDNMLSTVKFEFTSGASTYVVTAKHGSTTYVNGETRNNSETFKFSNVTNAASGTLTSMLDFMPVVPDAEMYKKSGESGFDITCTVKNAALGYERKALHFTGSNGSGSPYTNPYGLRSFVMTDGATIALGQNSSGETITTNNGALELSWRNGRL